MPDLCLVHRRTHPHPIKAHRKPDQNQAHLRKNQIVIPAEVEDVVEAGDAGVVGVIAAAKSEMNRRRRTLVTLGNRSRPAALRNRKKIWTISSLDSAEASPQGPTLRRNLPNRMSVPVSQASLPKMLAMPNRRSNRIRAAVGPAAITMVAKIAVDAVRDVVEEEEAAEAKARNGDEAVGGRKAEDLAIQNRLARPIQTSNQRTAIAAQDVAEEVVAVHPAMIPPAELRMVRANANHGLVALVPKTSRKNRKNRKAAVTATALTMQILAAVSRHHHPKSPTNLVSQPVHPKDDHAMRVHRKKAAAKEDVGEVARVEEGEVEVGDVVIAPVVIGQDLKAGRAIHADHLAMEPATTARGTRTPVGLQNNRPQKAGSFPSRKLRLKRQHRRQLQRPATSPSRTRLPSQKRHRSGRLHLVSLPTRKHQLPKRHQRLRQIPDSANQRSKRPKILPAAKTRLQPKKNRSVKKRLRQMA